MTNLYEISHAIEDILNGGIDPETGELIVDGDALDALIMERDAKIENIACYIKNLTAAAKMIKEEETALAERRKAAEKKAERLKEYLSAVLDGQKFQTAKCAVSFRQTQKVEIEEGFTAWAEATGNTKLLRYTAPEVNKVAVKALLAEGAEVPCARLTVNNAMTIK